MHKPVLSHSLSLSLSHTHTHTHTHLSLSYTHTHISLTSHTHTLCSLSLSLHTHTHAQHVSELGDISGVEDDLAVKLENTARTFTFKAFRCFHLAESYASMKKWPEALGLFDRALDHVTQALEHYRELEQERVDQVCVCECVCVVCVCVHACVCVCIFFLP